MKCKFFVVVLTLLFFVSALFFVSVSTTSAQTTTRKTTTKKTTTRKTTRRKPVAAQADVPDFSIAPEYLEMLRKGGTIQPTIRFDLGGHSGLHAINKDCEMHIAGEPADKALGDPNAFIIEPPNLCKVGPDGNPASMSSEWATIFDGVKGETCDVTGFPRIFTEHAKTGGDPNSNPLHMYEMHPTTQIKCASQTLKFGSNYVRGFQGMTSIKPTSATSCIQKRGLNVRFNSDEKMYEFQEVGGGTCGNFATIELDNIPAQFIQDVGNGHSAIARESADGESTDSLKIYTLGGTDIDTFLAQLKQSKKQQRKIVLGLFTYDYFAIQKVLFNPTTKVWSKPADWTEVPFPLAFVVYGEMEEAPFEEE